MKDIKNPFASKTVWGAILVVLGLLGRAFGVDVPKEEISGVIELLGANWENFTQLFGAILAIWGRITANKKLGFFKKNKGD